MNSTYKHWKNINSHEHSLSKIFENIQHIHRIPPTQTHPCHLQGFERWRWHLAWFHWFYYLPPCVEDQTQCLCALREHWATFPPLRKMFLLEWFCNGIESGQRWICLHLGWLKWMCLKLKNSHKHVLSGPPLSGKKNEDRESSSMRINFSEVPIIYWA